MQGCGSSTAAVHRRKAEGRGSRIVQLGVAEQLGLLRLLPSCRPLLFPIAIYAVR